MHQEHQHERQRQPSPSLILAVMSLEQPQYPVESQSDEEMNNQVGPVVGSLKKQTVILQTDQISFHTNPASSVLDRSKKRRVK